MTLVVRISPTAVIEVVIPGHDLTSGKSAVTGKPHYFGRLYKDGPMCEWCGQAREHQWHLDAAPPARLTPDDVARLIYANHREQCCTCGTWDDHVDDREEFLKLGRLIVKAYETPPAGVSTAS